MIQIEQLCVNLMDAARVLSIGRTTLYKLLKDKEIISYKIGRRRVVPVEEVHRYHARSVAESAK